MSSKLLLMPNQDIKETATNCALKIEAKCLPQKLT